MKKLICFLLCFAQLAFVQVVVVQQQNELSHDTAELYLDLMKKCLANTIYEDVNMNPHLGSGYNPHARENGLDWPVVAHTMIGRSGWTISIAV